MERPRRLTPKKNVSTEMIGLLPEEESALRKALLASMQSEKASNKKHSPSPSAKKATSKRGGRRGRGSSKKASGVREQSERFEKLDKPSEPNFSEQVQFSSSPPPAEPELETSVEMSQEMPEQSSDSDSNFSTEEFVRWTPGKEQLLSYNQLHLQESAGSVESDLSSYNGQEMMDFHLTLSQSDSTTPNEVSSPLPSDNGKHCYHSLDSKLATSSLYIAQKRQSLPHELGRQNQSGVLNTEDFVSFLCMRSENEHLPGLMRHFNVTKTKGATRASSQCRKRKLGDQKKKHAAKKLLFYK